jgi:hypothetical protein
MLGKMAGVGGSDGGVGGSGAKFLTLVLGGANLDFVRRPQCIEWHATLGGGKEVVGEGVAGGGGCLVVGGGSGGR